MGEIEKGAQERMEALRAKKKQLQMGKSAEEMVPKLIGHVEKVEEEEIEEGVEGSGVVQKKGDDDTRRKITKGATVGEEEGVQQPEEQAAGTKDSTKEDSKKSTRSTPSAAKRKEEKRRARMKEKEKKWKEATEKGLGEREGDLDLEEAMMSPEEGERQTEKTKKDTEESDMYGKVYTKTHERRAERSVSRAERKEQEEQKKKEEVQKAAAEAEADRIAQEEAKHVIERAQLEEEELAVQKRLERKRRQQESAEKEEMQGKSTDVATTSKQQWKEQLGLKAKQRRRDEGEGALVTKPQKRKRVDEEEEYVEPDDEDNDPDYNPTEDPEQDYEEEDRFLNDEETFEIEKHVHTINLQEAGAYVVEIRRFVSCFAKVVRKAKTDVAREYRKLIHYMREMVLSTGCYGPIEHADEEAVFKTILDPSCTAWRRAMHGAKTGNSKDLQRIEETRVKVLKATEDREIPPEKDLADIAGTMENRTPEDRQHVKDMIKRYWAHTARAHEEAGAAASILRLLADEMDEASYTALITAGTRPLIMVEVPQMARQAAEIKQQREQEEKAEDLRSQPIEEIIVNQNMPVPCERWAKSSIMMPTQYLAAMVYYFVAAAADETRTITNKGVAALFNLQPSNLHKLVSGRKYAGGSKGEGKKASSLQELEDRSEPMVKVIKKKVAPAAAGSSKGGGRGKSSDKVKVTKAPPKLIPLPFLDEETPAAGTRSSRKKQKGEDTDKK